MRSRSTAVSFVQTHTNLHQPFGGRPSQDSVLVTLFGAGEEELKALGASMSLGSGGLVSTWPGRILTKQYKTGLGRIAYNDGLYAGST